MKWICISTIGIAYLIYFGFAMKLNNPFNIPHNLNSSVIIEDYIFANNKGLALLILNISTVLFFVWDKVIKYLLRRCEFKSERTGRFTKWANESPILKRFFNKWLVSSSKMSILESYIRI